MSLVELATRQARAFFFRAGHHISRGAGETRTQGPVATYLRPAVRAFDRELEHASEVAMKTQGEIEAAICEGPVASSRSTWAGAPKTSAHT